MDAGLCGVDVDEYGYTHANIGLFMRLKCRCELFEGEHVSEFVAHVRDGMHERVRQ